MKRLIILLILVNYYGFSQTPAKLNESLMKELAAGACQCIDSISVDNKSKDETAREVNKCIEGKTSAYMLGSKLMGSMPDIVEDVSVKKNKKNKKDKVVTINLNQESDEYKAYYYELERYVMGNCESVDVKMAANNKENDKSFSQNQEAVALYYKGLEELEKENYQQALPFFEKALKIDSIFAFAWDNVGICHRKLGDYDKALWAYQRSLEIDPNGLMPLQNIAVAYQYKKEYVKAIESFEKLATLDKNNPEVYYGIGHIYATNLKDYEKALINMCKAYNLYIELKSPYRTDAEKMISSLYTEMKKQGQEARFSEILKENNIKTQ